MKQINNFWVCLCIVISTSSFAQQKNNLLHWEWTSFEGNLSLTGQYNEGYANDERVLQNYQYGGGISLSTESYLWHPNFLTVSMYGNYSPQIGQTNSTEIPDYFSNYSNRNMGITTRFLSSLPYKFNIDASHQFQKGEERTYDVDIEETKYRIDFIYNGPIEADASVEHRVNERFDNFSRRSLLLEELTFKTSLVKNKSKLGYNRLNINFQDINSKQTNLFANTVKRANAIFNNNKNFDVFKGLLFNTNVIYNNITGTNLYKNIGISEQVNLMFTKKLKLTGNYNQSSGSQNDISINNTEYGGTLSHLLYSSLKTSLGYTERSQKSFNNAEFNGAIKSLSIDYTKKVPIINGNIGINYSVQQAYVDSQFSSYSTKYINEQYVINDGDIVLLRNLWINKESILITNLTGSVIYEDNIDYLLIELENRIQIQRLVGGRILNGETVKIDYEAYNNDSYSLDATNKVFNVNLKFFKDLITLNYNKSSRTVENLVSRVDVLKLGQEDFEKSKYGVQLKYKALGFESFYEKKESSMIPYELINYTISASGSIARKFNYIFNGGVNNYLMYSKEGITNKTVSVSSNINYGINAFTKLNLGLNYVEQRGYFQNYNLITANGEFSKKINQLELSFNVNYYIRDLTSQNYSSSYLGALIKLKRNF